MALPKINLTAGTPPVEGSIGTYLITLDTAAPAGGLMVDYNTTGSTATFNKDYNFTAGANLGAVTDGSFTIVAGAKTATLNVVTVVDTVVDNETVMINVKDGAGYDLSGVGFAPYTDSKVGKDPQSVISADFNGDGNADLAATAIGDTVSVLLGNGTGDFSTHTDFTVGYFPSSVISADFNGDGKTDLATSNRSGGTVSVLLNNANIMTTTLTITDDGLYVPLILHGDDGGVKNDVLTGNNGADVLRGWGMADTLSGGIGNDELHGGKGNDSCNRSPT